MFDKVKEMWQLRGQMAEIKKRLDEMEIKVTSPKHIFEITLNGSQDIKAVKLLTSLDGKSAAEIEQDLKDVINKSIKDSQALAVQAMGAIAGMQPPQA
ncbi:hypothetical protein Dip518_001608 [Parelusimicrobium proximum]|uniref:YbaB/EbfC family nucleoid-associated protein n=1 Tax=Parelusimicrobium proximum TaxID=3228953 RepID=UPI003D17328C